MKKIISLIICFVFMLSLASCGGKDYVGVDKAKQTVVDDIGAAIEDVEFAVNDLVTDDNGDYYKIHFTKDGKKYQYKVDAMTGEIIDKNSSFDDTDDNSDVTTTDNNDMSNGTDTIINNNDNTDNNSNNKNGVDNGSNATSKTEM